MAKVAPKNPDLTIEQLQSTHELHQRFKNEWNFLYAAYEGTRELVNLGYLVKNERETPENYTKRKEQAYGFDYTQSVVDVLNFYLFKKPVKRNLPEKVENDSLYKMFSKDCDLENNNIDEFLTEISRLASIMGMVGVLVDKSSQELDSRQQQIDEKVYPYLCSFFPQAILDWEIKRNEFGRPTLTMIKLLQDDDRYVIWYEDQFEIWEVPLDEQGRPLESTHKAQLVNAQSHDLGLVPFVFVINKKWKKRPIGKSDVSDIARIDVSIIRNLSQGEEVIDYSAFPMMRKPFQEGRPDGSVDKSDDVGPTAVLGFDPDNPDSKPDWLESEAASALTAIQAWILNKVAEIYRSSNIGGMAATEISTAPKSGTALQAEFQMLNSALVRKAVTLEKVESQIYNLFYLWEFRDQVKIYLEETTVERERSYDVEDLANDLENILTAKTIVMSKTFDAVLQKKTVRKMLPSYNDSRLKEIDDEIDQGTEEKEKVDQQNPDYNPFDQLNLNKDEVEEE